jgi:hypothetical protein
VADPASGSVAGPSADEVRPPAALTLTAVTAALFAPALALSLAGAASDQVWLAGSAMLLACAVSIVAVPATVLAVVELSRFARARSRPAILRASCALGLCAALLAAPAWTLLLDGGR